MLIEHTYTDIAFADHTARIGQFFSRKQAKKCGLTATVWADKTNNVIGLDIEPDVLK